MIILSPVARFWIAVITAVAIGVSQGALNLTGAIPDQFIRPVTAWCGIIAFIASAVTAAASAAGLTTANRLASAASVEGVKSISVTPEVAAQATPQTKQDAHIVTVG